MRIIKILKSKPIFLPVRYPKNDDFKDGYFQRVIVIDDILASSGLVRVYVSKPSKFIILPKLRKIKKDVWEILASDKNIIHISVIFLFGLFSQGIYLHSIMRIKTPFHLFMFLFAKKRMLDLHGSVPEEVELYGKKKKAIVFNKIERLITRGSDVIISVSNSMTDYLKAKHNLENKKFIFLPIFNKVNVFSNDKVYSRNAIYCGGMQRWQQIEKMFEYVNKHESDLKFTFLVPNPQALLDKYKKIYGKNFPGIVTSSPPDEISKWYSKNSFGLIFRENITVNRVACPTKMIEYLQNDIVPIIDFEDIGDFNKFGYEYVHFEEDIPNEDNWNKMIYKNREVYKSICDQSFLGAEELKKYLINNFKKNE